MEPERPIEKLLRAYGKRRGEEAGAALELHPATRRRLQSEVTRQFCEPERPRPAFWRWRGPFWPRLAWGLAVLALLGVAARLVLPGLNRPKSPQMLARNNRVPAAPAAEAARPPPAPLSLAESSPAEKEPGARPGQRMAGETLKAVPAAPGQVQAPAPEPIRGALGQGLAPSSGPAPSQAFLRRYGLASQAARSSPGNTSPAAPAARQVNQAVAGSAMVAPASLGEGIDFKNNAVDKSALPVGAPAAPEATAQSLGYYGKNEPAAVFGPSQPDKATAVVRRFVRVGARTGAQDGLSAQPAPANPLLAAFQVEQSGGEMRITDGDGSVYAGYLRLTNAPVGPSPAAAEQPARLRREKASESTREPRPAAVSVARPLAAQYYFFRVAGTNRGLNQRVVFTGNLLKLTNSPPMPDCRIWGKALVGDRQEIQIDAVSRKP